MSKAYKPLPAAEDLWELFSYNPLTGNLHWRTSPARAVKQDQAAGFITGKYRMCKVENTAYLCHRLIWKWVTGRARTITIDHKDVLSVTFGT